MRTLSAMALVAVVAGGCVGFHSERSVLAHARRDAAQRTRRLIFNNDGDDHIQADGRTVDAFLQVRSTPLIGSQVDTIVYCTSRPFGMFTHNTKVGQVLDIETFPPNRHNIVPDLIAEGTDPLQVMSEFCRENGFEIIWSMRMNDTHDSAHSPENPHYYFSDFKRSHPECLLGTRANRPRIGAWNAVNYECDAVRDFALRVFEEICREYDVDGIEMDFFRHLVYFPSVAAGGTATARERELMTDLVRRTRRMMDQVSLETRRPLLLTVRTPDSAEFCRAMGLDLPAWLREGLIDVLVAGGDFRLDAWQESVRLGSRHGVPVWCDLDPAPRMGGTGRFPRNDIRATRGRAAAAWAAGASAIYYFNWFNPEHPLWRETGSPEALTTMPKWYPANATGHAGYLQPQSALLTGLDYDRRTQPHPAAPRDIPENRVLTIPMEIASEPPAASCKLHVLATGPSLAATWNGTRLEVSPDSPAQGQWTDFVVPAHLLQAATAVCTLTPKTDPGAVTAARQWDVDVSAAEIADDAALGVPFNLGRGSARTRAAMQGDALRITDEGSERGDYLYCSHGWNASNQDPRRAQFEVQVLSGRNGIILADGIAEERFWLYPDRIEAEGSRLQVPVDLTGSFHLVTIEVETDKMRLSIDGTPRIDLEQGFTQAAVNGRNVILFGASTSETLGDALWKAVRYSVGGSGSRVYDVVLSVTPP